MVHKLTAVFALLFILASCGYSVEITQQLSEGDQNISDALVIANNDELQETAQHALEEEQSFADTLVMAEHNEQHDTTQKASEDEQTITESIVDANHSEQQEVSKQLSEEERNIAGALVIIAHNMLNIESYIEYPILYLLEDAVVEVSYVPGYFWRYSGHYNEELVAIAPEGITCFLRPPEPSWDGYTHWALMIGKRDDNTYFDHIYVWYPDFHGVEEHIGSSFENQPLEDIIQTFDLYIPQRNT